MTTTAPTSSTTPGPTAAAARLPRSLHPGAWWLWAVGLAVAATTTTNPLILGLIIAVAGYVVVARRGDAPWAMAFRLYLVLGAVIVVFRVFFRLVFGASSGTVLIDLPSLTLPTWLGGLRLFGPVTAESMLGGLYDGLQLATLVICIGAANALANPKRLLKAVPGALSEVGTAVVVALSVFPQLAESVVRVRRARRLRGGAGRGVSALRGIVVPVLEDALDRSLQLAAAMDSRGYGRSAAVSPATRLLTGALTIVGILAVSGGVYGVLDGTSAYASDGPRWYLGAPLLIAGVVMAAAGFVITGRRVRRTRFRPDRWRAAELVTVACGVVTAAALLMMGSGSFDVLHPQLRPPTMPTITLPVLVAVLVAALPAWLTPPSSGPSDAGAGR